MEDEKLSYSCRGVTFTWEGGEYIDVWNGGEYAVATNNVWTATDGVGHATIPFTQDAFEAECDAWLAGLRPEEIAEYGVTSK